MESISQTEDYLIDGLSFKLPPGSSYITDRRKSTYYASGSNIYSVNGTKVVRFVLNGEDGTWLDPSTVRVQYDLRNNEGIGTIKDIRPLGGAHLFFRRGRCLIQNTLCEDINDFNRMQETLDSLKPDAVRDNIDLEGFGTRWDDHYNKWSHGWGTGTMPGIKPGAKKTVCFKPCFGLLSQRKLFPLKYASMVLEFELINGADDAIITPGINTTFTTTNTGNNWSLENMCIKCDCVSLDSTLNNEYTAHLLKGASLPIQYSTYINQQNAMAGTTFSVQITRAVSRLQKAFITFYKTPTTPKLEDKVAIKFYHPIAGLIDSIVDKDYEPTREMELSLQLGPKNYPEYPCKSLSEAFTILKQTINLPDWGLHSVGIDYRQYFSNKFIFGMNFEKVPESSFTGISSKAGQVLIVKMNMESSTANKDVAPDTMYVSLMAEHILEIRDTGASVYD